MPQNAPRLVDKESSSRSIPMKVLVLGMSRTGTFSMYTALGQLGYKTYHMAEAMKDPPRTFRLWEEALNAKFKGQGEPWGRREFDVLLGDYDALADLPCVLFIDELVAAYPDAKVILTNRDVDSWLRSMKDTAFKVMSWPSWLIIAPFDPERAGPWYSFGRVLGSCLFPAGTSGLDEQARRAYIEHYEHVRKVVPKERLLEFEAKDGWGPLCEFLGRDKPEGEYPRVNDSADFVKWHAAMWRAALAKASVKVSLTAATMAVALLAGRRWGPQVMAEARKQLQIGR